MAIIIWANQIYKINNNDKVIDNEINGINVDENTYNSENIIQLYNSENVSYTNKETINLIGEWTKWYTGGGILDPAVYHQARNIYQVIYSEINLKITTENNILYDKLAVYNKLTT